MPSPSEWDDVQIATPDIRSLQGRLEPTSGVFWRSRWLAHAEPLDDSGSRIRGGRYNPRKVFGALYFSTTLEGSLLELASRRETVRSDAVAYEVEVSVEKCLDFVSIEVRRALSPGIDLLGVDDLTQRDVSTSLAIAGLALGIGAEGLLVPSAAWHRLAEDGIGVGYVADSFPLPVVVPEEFANLVILRPVRATVRRRVSITNLTVVEG